MGIARFAVDDDIDEIVRLRQVMLEEWLECHDNGWREETAAILRRRLGETEPTMAVTVVDTPDGPGTLAACAAGVITERLPSPLHHTGLSGWVFNVSTDPVWRRRGFSRACMEALLGWFDDRGIRSVDLHASSQGEGLYRQLGFQSPDEPAMRRTAH
ncbi:GNAT family N-acetyltransferase [Glycomyces arizonensis]|uniref:GNAT family N-acetyltransferase n=1 Tax=Glycomyces arizonensis TaxID=256035 RepID=UPI000427C3C3|nr:GNAT family N-acetyltransferase [Glycomyces arizonensis]